MPVDDCHSIAVTQGDPNFYSERRREQCHKEQEGNPSYDEPDCGRVDFSKKEYDRCSTCQSCCLEWRAPEYEGRYGTVVCGECGSTMSVPPAECERVEKSFERVSDDGTERE